MPRLTIAYVGSRGVHLPYHTDDANIVMPTKTAGRICLAFRETTISNGTVLNPNVGDINRTSYDADSYFHSLQVGYDQQLSHGLQLRGAYTWGRSIDSGSSSIAGDQFANSPSSLPLWFDPRTRRGLSDFNLSQNGVVSILWNTPRVEERIGIASLGGERMAGWFDLSGQQRLAFFRPDRRRSAGHEQHRSVGLSRTG